jgi:hydrogenase maturation protease
MNIRILGLGNALMSDDAFGPSVVRVLDALYEMPPNVHIIDAGAPGRDIAPHLVRADVVILVDTVETGGVAGDIHSYQLDELLRQATEPLLCPHDPGIREALLRAAAAGSAPEHVILFGVVPEWEATGATLSRPVRSSILPVVGLIVAELERRLGAPPVRRAVPRIPDLWWERGADLQAAVATAS